MLRYVMDDSEKILFSEGEHLNHHHPDVSFHYGRYSAAFDRQTLWQQCSSNFPQSPRGQRSRDGVCSDAQEMETEADV